MVSASYGNPINEPLLGLDEISNSTSYFDVILAAPSVASLRMMWITTVLLTPIIFVTCTMVFVAILRNDELRSSPFNYYLLFLLAPDILLAIFCTLSCFMNAIYGHVVNEFWCRFQSIYVMFAFGMFPICFPRWRFLATHSLSRTNTTSNRCQ